MLKYFSLEKKRNDTVFSGSFFASIFKQFVRHLSKISFCMEKDNVSTSFTFFMALFPVISDSKFGFRRGRSTIDAIFLLQSLIQKVLNQKERLYCAFVDL